MDSRLVRRSLAILLLIASFTMHSPAQNDGPKPPFRLPSDVAIPVHYSLSITVIPDQETFTGTTDIDLNFKKPSSALLMHAANLEVTEATLTVGKSGLPLKVVSTSDGYVRFEFPEELKPGPGVLHVTYRGTIHRKDLRGVFQIKDGDQWYVYTQFEDMYARQAFPCFDDPNYKVPWQLTLHVKKEHAAISNTPILSEVAEPKGMKAVRFAETKPMPSYLVGFAVGPFDFVDGGTAGAKHTPIRIVVPHARGSEARFAAETTGPILNLLERYFSIPYPYEKLDEVAVPFSEISMEHPGMITHGGFVILSKPGDDSLVVKQRWVSVAAHELAHQWFGDLVTMAWWDDVWLNEGFATWMANKIANEYNPEWHMGISELNYHQYAMRNDALVSARRVRQPIESEDDIRNSFDEITYYKGSALLNMFESYMGQKQFRKGVQAYLKQYAWKNATSEQFLAALTFGDTRIPAAFSTFLDQPGVPLISAGLKCDTDSKQLNLSQQRFLPLGSSGSGSELWKIPICIRYPDASGTARKCSLLDGKAAAIELDKAKACPKWIEVNADASGYYRVAYHGDLLNRLLENSGQSRSVPEKVSAIDDLRALTTNGMMPLSNALSLAALPANDANRWVVAKTLEITSGLQNSMIEPPDLPKYRQYLMELYGARAHQLGLSGRPDDTDDDRLLRPALDDALAHVDDAEIQAEAKRLTLAWFDNHNAVSADNLETVLIAAAMHGDRDLFDRMLAAVHAEKNEQVQYSLLVAIGSFQDPEIAKVAFSLLLGDELNPQLKILIISGAARNASIRDLNYQLIKQNWDTLTTRLTADIIPILPFIAAGYCDQVHRNDVKDFFDGRSTKYPGGPRNLQQALELIDLCIAYKQVQQPSLNEFLRNYGLQKNPEISHLQEFGGRDGEGTKSAYNEVVFNHK